MITRKATVKEFDISFCKEIYVKEFENRTTQGNLYGVRPPFACGHNSDWQLSHECTNCGAIAIWGDADPAQPTQKADTDSFVQTGALYGHRYEQPFLDAMIEAFDSLYQLPSPYATTEKEFCIVAKDWDLKKGIAVENINGYRCAHCQTNYLVRFTESSPIETERGTRGHIGVIIIDEIAEVSIADGETFEGLITKYRIRPTY